MLHLQSHTGCSARPTSCEDLKEARATAAEYLRTARRNGNPVSILKRGSSWEILEREDARMIGDDVGILEIAPPLEAPCWECGFKFAPEECYDRGDGTPTLGRSASYVCPGCANPEPLEDETAAEDAAEDETSARICGAPGCGRAAAFVEFYRVADGAGPWTGAAMDACERCASAPRVALPAGGNF